MNRIADGLLFATTGDRCRYLGKSRREKPKWLKENAGRYRRLEDIEQEPAQLGPSIESEKNFGASPTGPTCKTSSHEVREDRDDDDNLRLEGTPPAHCSALYQPTSLPASPNENVPNGPTQTDLPHIKAAGGEVKESNRETTPHGTAGRKRGRSGGRQVEKQKTPAGISKSARKLSPELMQVVIDALKECPIQFYAANKARIHRKTLEYWIKRSAAGDDGYDIECEGYTFRFHELCQSAIDEADDTLRGIVRQLAMGVKFKTDAFLVDLGYHGIDAYARDENGNFIGETVGPGNSKWIRFYLEYFCSDKWGKNRKIDVPQTGGLLIIGDISTYKKPETADKKPENNTAASVKARKWKSCMRALRKPV